MSESWEQQIKHEAIQDSEEKLAIFRELREVLAGANPQVILEQEDLFHNALGGNLDALRDISTWGDLGRLRKRVEKLLEQKFPGKDLSSL